MYYISSEKIWKQIRRDLHFPLKFNTAVVDEHSIEIKLIKIELSSIWASIFN